MSSQFLTKARTYFVLVFSAVLLAGCQIESEPKSDLDQIRERGVLRVGTLNNQLSYYIGPDGPAGLDYEIARQFAKELGVRLEMKPAYRISNLYPALENGEIDIIAAGLTQSPERMQRFRPGPAYYYVSQQLIYEKGKWRPRNLEQLLAKQNELIEENEGQPIVTIVGDSHFNQTLSKIQQEHPEFKFTIDPNADVNDLLKEVSESDIRFTVADSVEVSLSQRIYPDVATAFELTEDQPTSWFLRRSEDESLYAMVIEFFGHLKQSGELAQLEEKYIGHVGSFDYVDTRAFIRALDNKLPKWSPLFKQYSEEFDWRLIAALAYQESHWNPMAKSPTGVRGMMMLTLPTAKSVGVTNRLDPEQSVKGGVEYLRRMVARIPDSIEQHEKIWFALASYNVGYGHVMDARRLTKKQGGNPDQWSDVKERLPLLRQAKYHRQTRYGYARGDEAKNYVENIRRYYQSIIGHIEQQTPDEGEVDINDLTVIQLDPSVLSAASSSISPASTAIPAVSGSVSAASVAKSEE
ncbi:membrane-bound lytic murein transglycosylase MltF [Vibrio scophthalmi]|uniref:Membrane-bound lytic murein transglycosylase F n=2 Tax=Vibrio scophthalmi TaxID=45658 RepID=F9RJM4_9VIBR|nr:membrane-bound lytic murein transglycosylase MltF [Vibrio scophthalmi]ANS86161.1 Membrane-bound lytic murein transglycosylase [Vibrio scophthalmi]ANU35707.1 Membrane-bound lytic murein transglycosylase [Vibrio scophthalmi]EGU40768.1 putative transglycosylase [Vibrio scophthalmi LMG 19158]